MTGWKEHAKKQISIAFNIIKMPLTPQDEALLKVAFKYAQKEIDRIKVVWQERLDKSSKYLCSEIERLKKEKERDDKTIKGLRDNYFRVFAEKDRLLEEKKETDIRINKVIEKRKRNKKEFDEAFDRLLEFTVRKE